MSAQGQSSKITLPLSPFHFPTSSFHAENPFHARSSFLVFHSLPTCPAQCSRLRRHRKRLSCPWRSRYPWPWSPSGPLLPTLLNLDSPTRPAGRSRRHVPPHSLLHHLLFHRRHLFHRA